MPVAILNTIGCYHLYNWIFTWGKYKRLELLYMEYRTWSQRRKKIVRGGAMKMLVRLLVSNQGKGWIYKNYSMIPATEPLHCLKRVLLLDLDIEV